MRSSSANSVGAWRGSTGTVVKTCTPEAYTTVVVPDTNPTNSETAIGWANT